MENTEKANTKKSLMNSLDNLDYKVSALEGLEGLSYRLLKKFTNPHPGPESEQKEMAKENFPIDESLDLIDLFNVVSEKMDRSINSIGHNLEQILDMIE